MSKKRILWVDDEIDLLRPHILFLEEKGYEVTSVHSGLDALDYYKAEEFDIVFLDENMPGLSGIDTLNLLKEYDPNIPVVMITKNEDEGIMTDAIGKKIADYLIKPVNPHQILLSLKKNLHKEDIISEAALEGYRLEREKLAQQISIANSFDDWVSIYKRLVYWDIELSASQSPLLELLSMQKQEANNEYAKYIKHNYESWIGGDEKPLLSHEVFRYKVLPLLEESMPVLFLVIDNFRYDQWQIVKDLLISDYSIQEDVYCSILPTATQYARNALFSGLLPLQIQELYPHLWVAESDEEGKNMKEEELIQTFFDRFRKKHTYSYHKIGANYSGEKFIQQLHSLRSKDLNVLVMNFIDMLSHTRTESRMIRELASDEAAYRSVTRSWFKHSSVIDIFRRAAELGYKVILTTDHGTVRVKNAQKIIGDKSLNTNLRYKLGHNLEYDRKRVYEIRHPRNIGLPAPHIATKYIFASGDDFFAYPNNYNHYASYYTDTFQHGGISMDEMIIPFVVMTPK